MEICPKCKNPVAKDGRKSIMHAYGETKYWCRKCGWYQVQEEYKAKQQKGGIMNDFEKKWDKLKKEHPEYKGNEITNKKNKVK